MPDPVTSNYSLVLPTVGGDSGTWGGILNSGVMTVVDAALGANFSTVITSADVTLTTTQFQNAIFVVSGTLTGNRSLIVPFSTNFLSTTCVGGKFVVVNNGAGAFNLSVKTATTGGATAVVPQGFAVALFSDGFNVKYASDGLPGYAKASNGVPTSLPGTAGSVNTNASIAYDYTNNKLYMCTVSSTTSATWALPTTAAPAAPTFYTPDVQTFTSGSSATYTTATNGGNRPLFLRVRMIGGGGGGGAQASNAGSNGSDTSFSNWTAVHGVGGPAGSSALGGAGGSGGTNGTGTLITRISGSIGGGASTAAGAGFCIGGGTVLGPSTPVANSATTGNSAITNSGAGGSGGWSNGTGQGGGGGGGEYAEFIIISPASSYTYTVGAGGNGGSAGSTAGGNGAAGRIEVVGYWQ